MTLTQSIQPYSIKPPTIPSPTVVALGNSTIILEHAQSLTNKGEFALAISRAVTAYEVFIIKKLIEVKKENDIPEEEIAQIIQSTDKFSNKLEEFLNHTKIPLRQHPKHDKLQTIRKNRNSVVHMDRGFAYEDAVNAINTVSEIIKYITGELDKQPAQLNIG